MMAQVINLDYLVPYLPAWLSLQDLVYSAIILVCVSIAMNLVLLVDKRGQGVKVALVQAAMSKMQSEVKLKDQVLRKYREDVHVMRFQLEEQKKLLEKTQFSAEMSRISESIDEKQRAFRVERGYWDNIDRIGDPTSSPQISKLIDEKEEIQGMLEITKMKYHTRAIDEKSFSNITQEYQKKLIEIDSKLQRLQGDTDLKPAPTAAQNKAKEVSDAERDSDRMRKQIDWSLETKGDKTVLLISSKSENHNQIVLSLLETLILKRDMGGVYITISRPSDSIIDTLDAKGVPSENVFFVDCISQMSGKLAGIKRENVTYVDNPSSLEEISMFLERLLVKIKGDGKFIVLDSLSSLLIYNSDKSVREFAHFIINRARMQNITAVILSIEKKEAEDLVKTLAPMCDSELKF
jgi:hypothetical protein